MSRLNMVRKIKDSKKDPNKMKDIYESKREKEWNDRFIYNKLENNQEKRPLPKKTKNDYSFNIKYLKEQFNSENIKKNNNNKTRGKSGFKIHLNKNNVQNLKRPKGMQILKNNVNMNKLNNTEENSPKTNFKTMSKSHISLDNNNNNNNLDINYYYNISNNKNKYYMMPINELEICVELFWNNLGVREVYSSQFNKYKNETTNEEIQKEFLVMEAENLENLENFLKIMQTNIENREKTILLLKKLIEVIEKQFIELNLDIRENILNDFFQTLNAYRINTVKAVECIDMFRQFFTYGMNKGKFHEKVLMKKFGLLNDECVKQYKGNYLLKLKHDVNFLGKSKINGYKNLNINFGTNDDPFLLNASEVIPINKDYFARIKQSQYIIMQEIIYDQITNDIEVKEFNNDINNIINLNKIKINQNIKEININNNENNSNSKYIKKEKEKIDCIDKDMKNLNDKSENNNIINKNIYRQKKNEKIVIETQLIDRNNYENFFKAKEEIPEEGSDDQNLEDIKKGFDIIHNLNKNKKKDNEDNNIKDKKPKENLKSNNRDTKELLNIEKEGDIIIKENEMINLPQKEQKENKDDIIEEKLENETNTNNCKIDEKIGKEKNGDIKDIIEENIENEINKIQIEAKNDKQKSVINENKEKSVLLNKENKKNNNIIIEEPTKEENNIDTEKINEIQKPIVINSLKQLEDKDNNDDAVNIEINNNSINDKQNKDNNIENNSLTNSQILKKLEKSRSLTPKSQRESKILKPRESKELNSNEINKDNNQSIIGAFNQEPKTNDSFISFYCGKLSHFVLIYSTYFDTIPKEQKIIFNLKKNPLEYIHNNFYPKIILYSDKKTKMLKGLCIISHIYWKKNEIYIEHISSNSDEEKEQIFEMFLSFIKENAFNILGYDNNIKENDIYIDLYYKCEEGKFSLNEGIKNFFKNDLKFKWVKLENLDKYVRYMKIRHHFLINNGNNNNDLLNNEYDDNNILNQSILGRKEFNNESNNDNEEEEKEESDEDDPKLDISTVFELNKDQIQNNNNNIKEINNNIHKTKNLNLLNNFSIKNKTILKFNNKIYESKNVSNKDIKYSNPLNFVYLLYKIYSNNNKKLYETISTNINSFFTENDSQKMEQVIQKYTKVKTNLIVENPYYYSDISELSKKIKDKFKLNANINAIPPFDNCISFIYEGYHYNRIQVPKLEIFKERLTEQIFYMISKNENHAVLISNDLNELFVEKYINKDNQDNININFMNVYNNLSSIDQLENNSNILYIPAFEAKFKLVNNCYDKIPEGKKYNLYCYEDYYNIKYFTEELAINRNIKKYKTKIKKNNSINMNFEYDLIKKEQINQPNFIKNDFLLIVFDLNIMEQLREFPLLTLLISKEKFIKKE